MHIHCPHCRNPIEVIHDQELRDVTCPSCGSSFNLLPDETVTRTAVEHRTLGHFELLDRIGVGAFGEVWTAHDSELDRTVAIKLPRKGQLSAEEAESFLREARSAARLSHPGIVTVHEVGKADDQLFIVSDYVRGVTLADWLTGKRPTPKESVTLLAQLADAVQHAHEHGVIHRDLKPSNIMLDANGQPHIMDFGLAKREAGEITVTVEGKILGTPAYMSPEQAKGAAHDADARSDVYSLGAILFELLTGELPFRGNARMLVHQVINDEPPSPRRLNGSVPQDVETICLKCLEKEPQKRYQTAREMAGDLCHFLAGEPIAARPITAFSKAWRWCKRKPLVAGLSVVVLGLFLMMAIVAPIVALSQARLRQNAEDEAAKALRLLYVADMARARQAWDTGDLERLRTLLERHVPDGKEDELRGFEWYYLWRLWRRETDTKRIELPDTRKYTANNLAIPAKGSQVAVAHPGHAGGGPAATVVDIVQEKIESFGFVRKVEVWPPFIAISNNSEMLAFPADDPVTVVIRELRTRKERSIKLENTVNVVRFSPDGSVLAIGCVDCSIVLWDLKAWRLKDRLIGHLAPVLSLVFSPDGTVLISGGSDASLHAWNPATKETLWSTESHSERGIGLDYSPNGEYVASGADSTVAVRNARTGKIVRILTGPRDQVRAVAFSRDSRLLAAGSRDGQIRLWILPHFVVHGVVSGYNSMYALGFLPELHRLVFGGYEGRLVIREVQTADHEDVLPGPHLTLPSNAAMASPRCLAFSPDSRILAAIGTPDNRRVRLWKLTSSGADDLEPLLLDREVGALAVSGHGLMAVGDRASAEVNLFDLQTRQQRAQLKDPRKLSAACAAFSPIGQRLAVGYEDGTVIVWDVLNRQIVLDKRVHNDGVSCLCFCGDEATLMTGCKDCSTAVWDVDRAELIHDFGLHGDEVTAVAASRDGTILAAGHFAGSPSIKLWRGRSGADYGTLRGHTLTVWGLAIFEDKNTLASVGGDRTVRLWDLSNCEERFLIEEKAVAISLALSPDERTLAVGVRDGTIRLYRAATPAEVQEVSGWWRRSKSESRD